MLNMKMQWIIKHCHWDLQTLGSFHKLTLKERSVALGVGS